MGLFDKIQQQPSPKQIPQDSLEKQEIEFILHTIKHSNFKGEDLDILYKTVIKLQNQYTKLKT
jgi:hypothetical protein